MTKYLLECPDCESRFELRAYAPEKRVRCRRCGSFLIVPFAPGDPAAAKAEPRPLPPELQRKIAGALPIRRLAALAALLCLALLGGVLVLVQRREARLEALRLPPEPPKLTLETMPALLNASGFPLGRGFTWEYAVTGGGTEVREVLRALPGPGDAPEFEFRVRGSSQAGTMTLRVGTDGVRVAGEASAAGRVEFDEPPLLVPYPLYSDGSWVQEARGRGEGGATAAWSVRFAVEGVDRLETPAGRFDHAVRVSAKGVRAGRAVDETLWYQRGTGLVKRATRVEGRLEEAVLRRFKNR
jgi:hypothetical protein